MRQVPRSIALWAMCLAAACTTKPPALRPEPPTAAGPLRTDPAEVERLRALGYVGTAPALPAGAKTGVVFHDPARSAPGVNLLTNASFCSAQLMGMDGRVFRTWSQQPCFRWDNATLLTSGDLLVVWRQPNDGTSADARNTRFLLLLDWNGNVVFSKRLPVHHDAEVTPGQRILALTYEFEPTLAPDTSLPVRDNEMTLLDMHGEVLEHVSLLELVRSAGDLLTLQRGKRRALEGTEEVDAIHANSIEWMRQPQLFGRHPIYGPNNVLLCMRHQDALAIVNWESKRIVWAWGQGELSGPHDATLLPNGHILAFDNGLGRKWSRVIELDPLARKIVWQYAAPDRESFYTAARGACQRLTNGNTLITESDKGHAFEVTPDGTVVWDFVNPNTTSMNEPSVIARTRRFEGLTYGELAQRVESGQGLPFSVD